MQNHIQKLTSVEEQLMHILWELHQFRVKDILQSHPEPVPHHNTISTYLKILMEKGFLSAQKQGRILIYWIRISKADYADYLLQNLIDKYFEDTPDFVQFLQKKGCLPPITPTEDLKDLSPLTVVASRSLTSQEPKSGKSKKQKNKTKKEKTKKKKNKD